MSREPSRAAQARAESRREYDAWVRSKQQEKEHKEHMKLVRSWPRLEMKNQYGDPIYVNRRIYEAITKKVIVIRSWVETNKVIIEYRPRKGPGKGRAELFDIGPA